MNVRGQNFDGYIAYGRSVLLGCDLLPTAQGRSAYCIPADRHCGMIPLFTPTDRAERRSVPVQITFEIRKLERQCQSKSLILPGGRLESV